MRWNISSRSRTEEIYAETQQIDAAEILQASQVWLEAAGTIAASMPIIGNPVSTVMNSVGWEGAAADAALRQHPQLRRAMDELAEVMGEVGARLGAVAAAAEAVKLAVAPPGDSGPIGAVARALEARARHRRAAGAGGPAPGGR